ncbi:protein of unknown function [Methylorubrum extorquens]|uniref:Uncharacterized protein n=1 Tax=Methylorubrum extorquens TaxID=408 RepID=A0A2N9AVH5_METEX|nr:protein of unknown function [Methylorubrum extorquens]
MDCGGLILYVSKIVGNKSVGLF